MSISLLFSCYAGSSTSDVVSEPGTSDTDQAVVLADLSEGKMVHETPIVLSPVTSSSASREVTRQVKNARKADKSGGQSNLLSGVFLGAQESNTQFLFKAETSCCFEDHYWYLVNQYGDVWYLGYTGLYGNKIQFSMPNSIPAGNYRIELDAYIYDTINQQWLYWSLDSDYTYVPILVSTPDVGVIPNGSGCPSPLQEATLHMDNEDHNPQSKLQPWVGGTKLDAAKNTTFLFCRVSGYNFASLAPYSSNRTNFAVLRLGASCPPGSVPFSRYFDNENNNNMNDWSGNIAPNTNIENTTMHFCLFKGDGAVASGLPNLGFDYGVFAHSSFGFTSATGWIYTDDQDDTLFYNNQNSYSADPAWIELAKRIVTGGKNTTLYTARRYSPWCGDGKCNGLETSSSCPTDCEYCGNGICGYNENAYNCLDCASCGDGICSPGEYCLPDCGNNCLLPPCELEAQ